MVPQDVANAIDKLAEIQSQEIALRTEQSREERALQGQELALRNEQLQIEREKLELERDRDQRGYEFGVKSLDAQAKDRVHARECERGQRKDAQKLIIWILVIIAALIAYAMYLDKDAMAEELIKAVVFLAAGGAAGYGLAIKKKSKEDAVDDGQG